MLVIGTYQPEAIGQTSLITKVLHDLSPSSDVFSILLPVGTDSPESIEFCREYLLDRYGGPVAPWFPDWLVAQTDGNALFVSELLLNLEEKDQLVRKDGRWSLVGPVATDQRLPLRIGYILRERLDRLEPGLLDVLRCASVEGETFTLQVLSGVLKLDEMQLLRDIADHLVREHHLVREEGSEGLPSGGKVYRFRFNNTLTRRYVFENTLTQVEREALHEQVGKQLEEVWAGVTNEIAAQLAQHFESAKVPGKTNRPDWGRRNGRRSR